MPRFRVTCALLAVLAGGAAQAATYHVSPQGDDARDGLSAAAAWATFDRAFRALEPGDTLLLADGTYRQQLRPTRSGEAEHPITIRALNDGEATIDGEFRRDSVYITRDYIVVEGLVARNAARSVFAIVRGSHNMLRRCSGYDASPDVNSPVFEVSYPEAQYNLFVDCAAGGSGRKMFMFFLSEHNTMRRCFANWQRWDGRRDRGQFWPNGANLEFYGANHCTMENCIAYGRVPAWWSVSMFAQSNTRSCIGNRILGTIALNAGTGPDGTPLHWSGRPGGVKGPVVDASYRASGFYLGTSADRPCRDNVFRDCLARSGAGIGLQIVGPVEDCAVDHVTIRDNKGAQIAIDGQAHVPVSQCRIEGTEPAGPGARLEHRYVDGKLTDEPLWPWPMEERIRREMGISVTSEMEAALGNGPAPLAP